MEGVQWGPNEVFFKPTHNVRRGGITVCHSFVKQGQWEFLSDCTHHLVGQTVPPPELPDFWGEEREQWN